jgi:hypothetical protein
MKILELISLNLIRIRNIIWNIIKYLFASLIALLIFTFIFISIWGTVFSLRADPLKLAIAKNDMSVHIVEHDYYISIKSKLNNTNTGLIYYPGARVRPEAYIYKLTMLAKATGLNIYIDKPMFNFAVLGISDARRIQQENPTITKWYIGGHSLGGAMACQYLSNIGGSGYSGLILFGSYCSADISDLSIPALSIVGTMDGLTTSDKVAEYSKNLPPFSEFKSIEGMNHAQNGDYGDQEGDNPSVAVDADVVDKMQKMILQFMNK